MPAALIRRGLELLQALLQCGQLLAALLLLLFELRGQQHRPPLRFAIVQSLLQGGQGAAMLGAQQPEANAADQQQQHQGDHTEQGVLAIGAGTSDSKAAHQATWGGEAKAGRTE